MSRYILDTSALLCYLRDEPGADGVQTLLKAKGSAIFMHRVNLGELYYGLLKKDGERLANEAYSFIIQYPIDFLDDLSDPFLMTASRFKVLHGLGFADAFAAAASYLRDAILVTKDNDFRPLERKGLLKIRWINP